MVHGDTSTTTGAAVARVWARCAVNSDSLLYVDATATLGGMPVERRRLATRRRQRRPAEVHVRSAGHRRRSASARPRRRYQSWTANISKAASGRRIIVAASGPPISSNYLDLGMLMDYWSPLRLNHHTESTTRCFMLRVNARGSCLEEGLDNGVRPARPRPASALQ